MDEKALELIAVWPYDRFPYFLYGTVTEINEQGCVAIKEYGNGFWVSPAVLLPRTELMRVKAIHHELQAEEAKLAKEMKRQLTAHAKRIAPTYLHGLIGVKP